MIRASWNLPNLLTLNSDPYQQHVPFHTVRGPGTFYSLNKMFSTWVTIGGVWRQEATRARPPSVALCLFPASSSFCCWVRTGFQCVEFWVDHIHCPHTARLIRCHIQQVAACHFGCVYLSEQTVKRHWWRQACFTVLIGKPFMRTPLWKNGITWIDQSRWKTHCLYHWWQAIFSNRWTRELFRRLGISPVQADTLPVP